jgi:hypothetical protein
VSEQRKYAAEYKRIGRRLKQLDVEACRVISRKDNRQVFEIAYFLIDVGERIKRGYDVTEYTALVGTRKETT